jgi:hypothetical protein
MMTTRKTFALFAVLMAPILLVGNLRAGVGYVVDTTAPSGTGSLEQAIFDANLSAGFDTIRFEIPGAGPHIITPTSPFEITDPVLIDGYSEPGSVENTNPPDSGSNAILEIAIDGTALGAVNAVFDITAGGCILRGLVINNAFSAAGIGISGGGGNQIAGNFIGTLRNGIVPAYNHRAIHIEDSADNTIGGILYGDRNVLAGAEEIILIEGALASGNRVWGNLVGVNSRGIGMLSPTYDAIRINAPDNTIGGSTSSLRNVIGSSPYAGVRISGEHATRDSVTGNYIGVNVTGTGGVGNRWGVIIEAPGNFIGGATPGAGNVIGFNTDDGILIMQLSATGNTVEGNYIGIDPAGTMSLGNNDNGIRIDSADSNLIGGTTSGAANIICYNWHNGITIEYASQNKVQGNFIGADAGGAARGNLEIGIVIRSANENTIGGTEAGAGNVIGDNHKEGVWLTYGSGNVVQGNFIGTDPSGANLGNGFDGIDLTWSEGNLIGGSEAGAANVIGFNGWNGVTGWAGISLFNVDCTLNRIQGNFIGTNSNGASLGNVGAGVSISRDCINNLVGGTGADEGNVIAYNSGAGVELISSAGTENAILRNSIYENGGLGIDIEPYGVNHNDGPGDSDSGANNLQNFPRLDAAVVAIGLGYKLQVSGRLNSTANTDFRVEFYANEACDPSDWGEGERFLFAETVTTNGRGHADFHFVRLLAAAVPEGDVITATATDVIDPVMGANTSEFCHCGDIGAGIIIDFVKYIELPFLSSPLSSSLDSLWRLQVEMENVGPGTAQNVSVKMHAEESTPWLTIPDPDVFYGDIAEGDSSVGGEDSYTLDLSDWPGGSFYVTLELSYEDGEATPYTTALTLLLDPDAQSAVTGPHGIPRYHLSHNYPNPFGRTTGIDFAIPKDGFVDLRIYSVRGKLVRTLVRGFRAGGFYTEVWDGSTDSGQEAPPGIYFYQFRTKGHNEKKRMVLLR